jgi:molybdopterin-guanine dinucleotide biosynthesis protein B
LENKLKTILFAGFKGSGKTTALTKIAKKLSSLGYSVASVKNARKGDIEITAKDSWQHFLSGANPAVLISPRVVIIHESSSENALEQLMLYFRRKRIQYVLVEGLYKEMATKKKVLTVACAKNETELEDILRVHKEVDMITGLYALSGLKEYRGIRVFNMDKELDDIVALILKKSKSYA